MLYASQCLRVQTVKFLRQVRSWMTLQSLLLPQGHQQPCSRYFGYLTALDARVPTGRMMGAVYLTNKNPQYGKGFTASDVVNLQAILQSAGDSIKALQVYERESARVKSLEDMMALLSVDANEITPLALSDKAKHLTRAVRGTVYIVDDQCNEIYFSIAGIGEIRIPLSEKSLAGACIIRNEIINIPGETQFTTLLQD